MDTANHMKVRRAEQAEIVSLRDAGAMDGQIVHDSIHARLGWTLEYVITHGDRAIGYGSSRSPGRGATGRPYTSSISIRHRSRAFELFDAFLDASNPHAFEVQTSDTLDHHVRRTHETSAPSGSYFAMARPRCITRTAPRCDASRRRRNPDRDRGTAGRRGLGRRDRRSGRRAGRDAVSLQPAYGDIYMDVDEPFRRRGIGAYLVQELKRICYELGAIPCARCSTTNEPSRRTLQRAGFVPFAHILFGSLGRPDRRRTNLMATRAESPVGDATQKSTFDAELEERLVRYVRIDTQSDEDSTTTPSTERQLDLLRLLQDELESIGAHDVRLTDYAAVLATIPETTSGSGPTIAFLAHVDTAPQFNATGVKPIVHRRYDGGEIVLPDAPEVRLSPARFPYLAGKVGRRLSRRAEPRCSAPTTRQASPSSTMARHLLSNPDLPHGPIRICFTPDEEVGRA
jgi:GNAT superfamily N-acetyltransferase